MPYKMDRWLLLLRIIITLIIPQLVVCEESSTSCSQAVKAEAYIETAAAMLDRARENMPDEGNADCTCPPNPMDCEEVLKCGHNVSGTYEIWPRNRVLIGSITAYCDMETSGGGWTVIQRRGDFRRPAEFFKKPWHLYKNGFGDLRRDFWLGNENIFALTNQRKYYLRVDLTDHNNNTRYAFYDHFWIDNESQQYKLHIFDYSGDAGDSLEQSHDNQLFSTVDRDNDKSSDSCAEQLKGGWWYRNCSDSNLNGKYFPSGVKSADGIVWKTWKGLESLKMTEMKVRPMDFKMNLLDMDVEPA